MPTALQNALVVPTLLELAVRGERVELGKNGSELPEFHNWLSSYYPEATKRARARRVSGGQDAFYNSCQWAVKQLRRKSCLTAANHRNFDISDDGLEFLRSELHRILKQPRLRNLVLSIMDERDENDRELFMSLIARLAPDSMGRVFLRSSERYRAFLNAILEVDLDSLGGFLASAYELIQPVIAAEVGRKYELV
jgi:hypothetical protein